MIVRAVGGELWLFDQNDHAAICGVMAHAWGVPPFAEASPSVRQAAALHDNGWIEWDPWPRLNPESGHPHPYSHMPAEDYLAIWQRGLRRAWDAGDEVGLLVSLHATRFFAKKRRPEDQALLAAERKRQAEALARLEAASTQPEALPEPYATWHAWVFFWDALSLFLCEGWESPWTRRIPTAAGSEREMRTQCRGSPDPGADVTLTPFPFRGPLVLETSARVVPQRSYLTQADLDAAVGVAERRIVRWTVAPPDH